MELGMVKEIFETHTYREEVLRKEERITEEIEGSAGAMY